MKKFKSTNLGYIPKDWKILELGDVGEILNGLTYKPKDVSNKGVLVLRSSNIKNGRLSFKDNVYVDCNELNFNKVKKGDILICVRNGSRSLIGKNAIIKDKAVGAAFGAFMSVYRSRLNSYLIHLFDSKYFRREIHRNLGATINSINKGDLNKFKFPLPPKNERNKISKILNSWDEIIEKTEKLIEAKKQYKKSLMQQLLSGKIRFPEFEGNDWVEVKLKKYFKSFSSKNKENEDLPILSCSKVYGITLQSNIFDKRIASKDIRRYKVIEKNDLIYDPMLLWDASIGFLKEVDKGVISPAYNTFKFKDGSGYRPYFEFLFDTHYMRYNYKAISQGTNRRRRKAPAEAFLKIDIKVPPTIGEQKKIAEILELQNKEIELLKSEVELLKKQKKGLMQKLLTGKVRVNNVEVA